MWGGGYVYGGVRLGVALERELTDKTDVLLDHFALLFHSAQVVRAALALQPLQKLLVLFHYSEQLAFAVRLIQGFLLLLAELALRAVVRGLGAWFTLKLPLV